MNIYMYGVQYNRITCLVYTFCVHDDFLFAIFGVNRTRRIATLMGLFLFVVNKMRI